jgi:hypothetical protein
MQGLEGGGRKQACAPSTKTMHTGRGAPPALISQSQALQDHVGPSFLLPEGICRSGNDYDQRVLNALKMPPRWSL